MSHESIFSNSTGEPEIKVDVGDEVLDQISFSQESSSVDLLLPNGNTASVDELAALGHGSLIMGWMTLMTVERNWWIRDENGEIVH